MIAELSWNQKYTYAPPGLSSFTETPNDAKSYLLFFLFVDSSGLIERSLSFPCNLPKSEGPCTKSLHRYYFDATEDSETLQGYILYIDIY